MTLAAELADPSTVPPGAAAGRVPGPVRGGRRPSGSTAPGALHAFSVEHPENFWRTLLAWAGLPWSGSADAVLHRGRLETARFFPDVRLNYAEALLRPLPGVDDDRPALTAVHADRPAEHFCRARLRAEVQQYRGRAGRCRAARGRADGAIAPNAAGAVVAGSPPRPSGPPCRRRHRTWAPPPCWAASSRSSRCCSLARPHRDGRRRRCRLGPDCPRCARLVVLDDRPLPDRACRSPGWPSRRGRPPPRRVAAAAVQPSALHPVLLRHDRTAEGIVHGAGGTLLEHLKEHRLHGDLRPGDTLFFHTTAAWMMWNWQLSALASGRRIVLYDGPVPSPETLWRLVAEERVTVFGTSPPYLQLCQDAGYRAAPTSWTLGACGPCSPPARSCTTGSSTGSPSTSGRSRCSRSRAAPTSSAASCSATRTCPSAAGEASAAASASTCRRRRGRPSRRHGRRARLPQPVPLPAARLLRRPGRERGSTRPTSRQNPGLWTHGDLIEFDRGRPARLHGRSDGVLNMRGIRIGPAEIYRVLGTFPRSRRDGGRAADAGDPGGSRIVLLVVSATGYALDDAAPRPHPARARQRGIPRPCAGADRRRPRAAPDTQRQALRAWPPATRFRPGPSENVGALRNPGCLDRSRVGSPTTRAPPPRPRTPARRATSRGSCRGSGRRAGRPRPDPDDDFFDLGGTSPPGAEPAAPGPRTPATWAWTCPVQEFALAPTLRGLAQAVGGGAIGPTSRRCPCCAPDAAGRCSSSPDAPGVS